MGNRLKTRAILFIVMGVLFIYIAVESIEDTMWNFTTLLFAVIATLDFGLAIKLLIMDYKIKNKKE